MIKFEGLNKEFVQVKDCTSRYINGCKVLICPYCKDHIQGNIDKYFDCKTIIYEDDLDNNGRLIQRSQCMCYSKEHGIRDGNE